MTNGLGGYASGTVAGLITRRFHGVLIAALPSPFGRRMMLNDLDRGCAFGDGRSFSSMANIASSPTFAHSADYLREFRLEWGLPVWIYEVEGITLEKRLVMPHRQNTVALNYRLLAGMEIRPTGTCGRR